MLTIPGSSQRFCDGIARRQFLQIGGLALGGLSLPQILRAESAAAEATGGASRGGGGLGHKAIIMIYLAGGPPHQDLFDLKMDAPKEIRGEFKPISTSVPGIEIGEHMPRLAQMMDKFAIIRSLHGGPDQHASDLCMSGYPIRDGLRQSGHPSLGSVVSKVQGPTDLAVAPFIGLGIKTRNGPYGNPGLPGFLGSEHAAFRPRSKGLDDMRRGVSLERLAGRESLLASFDTFRRRFDRSELFDEVDTYTRRAFEVLTSSKLVEALDLDREHPAIRDRYGRGGPNPVFGEDAGPLWNDQFLMARRLVEAGVRCVTLSFGSWDRHHSCFSRVPPQARKLDQGITALVEDLHARGLQDDVSVIAWGEFGRTPRINKAAGRDHWPPVGCALLACGGMRTGQVIGSTDRLAEAPKDRPVHFQNVFATLYHQLGIDPLTTTVTDHSGRPHYLLDIREPIEELL